MKTILYNSFKFHRKETPHFVSGGSKYWFEIRFNENQFLYIYTFNDLSGWRIDTCVDPSIFLMVYVAILENADIINKSVK